MVIAEIEKQGEIRVKSSLDKAVTRLSNGTSPFVCNKSGYPRVGVLAERRRQSATKDCQYCQNCQRLAIETLTFPPLEHS
jgi:hypothetical protein